MKALNLLTIGLAAILYGCGGGGSDTKTEDSPEETTLSGRVADGYLVGATVCLDLNNNKVCDTGEPSTTTTPGGAYTLDATQAQIADNSILVEISPQTIDEDDDQPVGSTYVMSAPAQSNFVSPLTTMLQTTIDANPALSVSDAESLIKQNLGLDVDSTVSILEDYVAAAGDTSNTDADSYQYLYNVARVTASVIARNYEDVTSASEASGTSLDILVQIIVEAVIAELETITSGVTTASADGTFDSQDLTTLSGTVTTVDTTTLADAINQVEIRSTSTQVSDILSIFQSGMNWAWGYSPTGEYAYGRILVGSDNAVSEKIYSYDETSSTFLLDSDQTVTDEYIALTSTGWQPESDSFQGATYAINSDGSLDIITTAETLTFKSISEVDIAGKNIAEWLNSYDNGESWTSDNSSDTAVFSAGSKAYNVLLEGTDYYGIGYWNDGTCTVFTLGDGTNCSVERQRQGGTALTELSSVIGTAHYLGDNLTYTLSGAPTDTSGSVSFKDATSGAELASGSWLRQTLNTEDLIEFDIPVAVRHLTWDIDPFKAFLTVYDGYVRIGWVEKSFGQVNLYNDTAMQDLVDNFVFGVGGSASAEDLPLSGA